VSDHSLEIESGRYKNITREERICKNCNLNEIGDAYHFFLKCTANHSLRNNLSSKYKYKQTKHRKLQFDHNIGYTK
jgi:hypothetical protein